MGTAAVFAIASKTGGESYWKRIIGMTSDGTPGNLLFIAQEFGDVAKELGLIDDIGSYDKEATFKVMNAVVSKHSDWLFTDNIDNAQWVSHSAIFDPLMGKVELYDGLIEDLEKTENVPMPLGIKKRPKVKPLVKENRKLTVKELKKMIKEEVKKLVKTHR